MRSAKTAPTAMVKNNADLLVENQEERLDGNRCIYENRSLAGSLLYSGIHSSPNLFFSVGILSQFCSLLLDPTMQSWKKIPIGIGSYSQVKFQS